MKYLHSKCSIKTHAFYSEVYSEPCQTSTIEFLAKIINLKKLFMKNVQSWIFNSVLNTSLVIQDLPNRYL